MAQYQKFIIRTGTHLEFAVEECPLCTVQVATASDGQECQSGGSKLRIGAGTLLEVVGKAIIHLHYLTVQYITQII